ncbi:YncE family protein [Streptomyces milbemycinicus]|uniref:YncE family protein n=1 Tax=Streptomyces milbemycinicus TaxID=476552 RepID=A0ABW8M0M8_9ACTN
MANADPDTVGVIDAATHTIVEHISFGDGPTGIALTPDGARAYVTNNAVAGTVGVMATTVFEPGHGL